MDNGLIFILVGNIGPVAVSSDSLSIQDIILRYSIPYSKHMMSIVYAGLYINDIMAGTVRELHTQLCMARRIRYEMK